MTRVVNIILWNLLVFAFYGEDKRREKAGLQRASENMFVFVSFVMGAVGTLLGMLIFRQKLRSPKLIIIMPFALFLNLLVGLGLLQI